MGRRRGRGRRRREVRRTNRAYHHRPSSTRMPVWLSPPATGTSPTKVDIERVQSTNRARLPLLSGTILSALQRSPKSGASIDYQAFRYEYTQTRSKMMFGSKTAEASRNPRTGIRNHTNDFLWYLNCRTTRTPGTSSYSSFVRNRKAPYSADDTIFTPQSFT